MQKYLVVSVGSIGLRHLNNLRKLRPTSVIAALRLNSPQDALTPEGCDLQFFNLDDVQHFSPNAAIIASPASTHTELTDKLVRMRVPVLVEKPFSDSLERLQDIANFASLHHIPIMIGYNLRFKASLLEVRKRILSGLIGDVLYVRASVGQYLPDWRPNSDYRKNVSAQKTLGGGALLELSHEIDYIYWIFGKPKQVSCRGAKLSSLEIDVEDVVELCLEYENPKRIISIHLDFIQRKVARTCSFIGTDGTLIWDGLKDTIEIFNVNSNSTEIVDAFGLSDGNQPYVDELEHFLQCVETGAEPIINATQGIDVMAIIVAAKKSMDSNSTEFLS